MGFAKKAYNATFWWRMPRTHNEMVANDAPENYEYVRPRRHKQWLHYVFDDIPVHHQRTWKIKRHTQYRPDGRNAYQITIKYKAEKKVDDSIQAQFATSDEWKTETSRTRYTGDVSCYKDIEDIEEVFRFQGIEIQQFGKDPDPETLIGMLCFKVYGDRKEGVRRYIQRFCDLYGLQMEVEYI